jgi:hypothetical protein
MTKKINIIAKYMLLSVSVVYLFISLSYIFFLPKYNINGGTSEIVTGNVNSKALYGNEDSNRVLWLHRVYKSISETKRNSVVPRFSVVVLLTVLFFGGAHRFTEGNSSTHGEEYAAFRRRSFFLSHCPLRV